MTNASMSTRRAQVSGALGFGVCFGLLCLLGAATTHAREMQPVKPAAGPTEGLRVHGHWIIDVREPDGSLVVHREFENALVIPAGATHLANILGRATTVGGWRIHTIGAAQVCEDPAGGSPAPCEMIESTDGLLSNAAFKTLTVGISGAVPPEVVLDGSLVAQLTGDISQVSTFNLYCAGATSPSACPGGTVLGADEVTRTTLVSPIPVAAGQQVQVRVLISFS